MDGEARQRIASENLTLLHEGEEKLRVEALERVSALPDMSAHLSVIEASMDLIHALLPSTTILDEDQLMLGNLGIRMFNALASATKLLLSGYYQAAALHLRDILETVFLLDYFSTDAALVTRWRTMSEKDRKREFRPVAIRIALDNRDGFTGNKRAEAYDLLCKLAGHATPEGVVMLVPDRASSNVHCGPFLEDTALQALISESARLAVQAAGVFRMVVEDETLDQTEARIDFAEAEAEWFERFYGRATDRVRIAEWRADLATARLNGDRHGI